MTTIRGKAAWRSRADKQGGDLLSTIVDGAMDSRLGCPRSSCAEDDGLASLDIVARAGRRRLVVHDGVGGEVCIWLLMV